MTISTVDLLTLYNSGSYIPQTSGSINTSADLRGLTLSYHGTQSVYGRAKSWFQELSDDSSITPEQAKEDYGAIVDRPVSISKAKRLAEQQEITSIYQAGIMSKNFSGLDRFGAGAIGSISTMVFDPLMLVPVTAGWVASAKLVTGLARSIGAVNAGANTFKARLAVAGATNLTAGAYETALESGAMYDLTGRHMTKGEFALNTALVAILGGVLDTAVRSSVKGFRGLGDIENTIDLPETIIKTRDTIPEGQRLVSVDETPNDILRRELPYEDYQEVLTNSRISEKASPFSPEELKLITDLEAVSKDNIEINPTFMPSDTPSELTSNDMKTLLTAVRRDQSWSSTPDIYYKLSEIKKEFRQIDNIKRKLGKVELDRQIVAVKNRLEKATKKSKINKFNKILKRLLKVREGMK